ncbi:MAG: hypothetical protein ACMUEM_02080 [Flavobacteriales bacterium AspAUS03]
METYKIQHEVSSSEHPIHIVIDKEGEKMIENITIRLITLTP